MKLLPMILLISMLGLTACEGGEIHYGHYYAGPELYGFNMIDSYGVDTEVDYSTPLALHPYEYDGWFDLSWDVDSQRDYVVEVGVSNSPAWSDADVVGSDFCGRGLSCASFGTFVCRYTSDFYMGCGQSEDEADLNLTSIYHLIDDLPEKVFLNLSVCDAAGAGCERSSLEVWLY